MRASLKKITGQTLQDLLQNEIILPSSYFKHFDQNAKKLSVNISDNHFENEVNNVIAEELQSINDYMNLAVTNIDVLSEQTENAQIAIAEKDSEKLKTISKTIMALKEEINFLRESIHFDPLTKAYNRRWIFNQAIKKDGTFKENGLLLLINLTDCDYLTKEHGSLVTDNVILYICKFVNNKFKSEGIAFSIARYSQSQFLLFIKKDTEENIIPFVKNIRLELSNTTLKSKSGLIFKTSFNFGLVSYMPKERFSNFLEQADALSIQENE